MKTWLPFPISLATDPLTLIGEGILIRTRAASLFAVCLLTGCTAQNSGNRADQTDHLQSDRGGIGVTSAAVTSVSSSIDPRRSLAVTDTTIVSSFTLKAVLNQLAAQAGIQGLDGTQLFKQLWDMQNPNPGLTSGPHCSDNNNTVNGFPYACRPQEGNQAVDPTTSIGQYDAVGLFNRFDLAPSNGANCGEYRIVFAKKPGGGRSP